MAKQDDRQQLFDFSPEPIAAPVEKVSRLSYRDALVEQIVRDAKVLDEDPCYHVPSEEFYIDRIIAYKAEVAKLDNAAKEQ